MTTQLDAHAVVLAGGIGSRFWPASTPERPKQLLPLAGPRALIEETLDRAHHLLGPGRVAVVTSNALATAFDRMGVLRDTTVLTEPTARGTGPALAWAAHQIASRDPDAVMISMHADHRIEPAAGLAESVVRAAELAREGYLVCIGARPDRPETGYGYVRLAEDLGDGGHSVEAFVEKPDTATAAGYLADGRYLWNTGIFVWRVSDLLAAIRELAPEIPLEPLERGDVETFFDECVPIAIDVAVMERAERVATVEARFEWDDVGVWDALGRVRESDAAGNIPVGRVRLLDATDNIVWTEHTRASVIGVSGLVVVEAHGELLVLPRDRAAELREIRARLDEFDDSETAGS
ncbi:MAG: mannose-1-phosphate guanylyltransferase [Gemmatimonadota bacterium]|nr:mannose-1-phosphate guanylyltransferase [Gemmatimonadota bacterium]